MVAGNGAIHRAAIAGNLSTLTYELGIGANVNLRGVGVSVLNINCTFIIDTSCNTSLRFDQLSQF